MVARVPTLDRRVGVPGAPRIPLESPELRAQLEVAQSAERFSSSLVDAKNKQNYGAAVQEITNNLSALQLEAMKNPGEPETYVQQWTARGKESVQKTLKDWGQKLPPDLQASLAKQGAKSFELYEYNRGVTGYQLERDKGRAMLANDIDGAIRAAALAETPFERENIVDLMISNIGNSGWVTESEKQKLRSAAVTQTTTQEINEEIRVNPANALKRMETKKEEDGAYPGFGNLTAALQNTLKGRAQSAIIKEEKRKIEISLSELSMASTDLQARLSDDDITVDPKAAFDSFQAMVVEFDRLRNTGFLSGPQQTKVGNQLHAIVREMEGNSQKTSDFHARWNGGGFTDGEQDQADFGWTLSGLTPEAPPPIPMPSMQNLVSSWTETRTGPQSGLGRHEIPPGGKDAPGQTGWTGAAEPARPGDLMLASSVAPPTPPTPSFAEAWAAAPDISTKAQILQTYIGRARLFPKQVANKLESQFRTGSPEEMAVATGILSSVLEQNPQMPLPPGLDPALKDGVFMMKRLLNQDVPIEIAAQNIKEWLTVTLDREDKKALGQSFSASYKAPQQDSAYAGLRERLREATGVSSWDSTWNLYDFPPGLVDSFDRLVRFHYVRTKGNDLGVAVNLAIDDIARENRGWGVNTLNPGMKMYQLGGPQRFYPHWSEAEMREQMFWDLVKHADLPDDLLEDSNGNPYLKNGKRNEEANPEDLLSQVVVVSDGFTLREKHPKWLVQRVYRTEDGYGVIPLYNKQGSPITWGLPSTPSFQGKEGTYAAERSAELRQRKKDEDTERAKAWRKLRKTAVLPYIQPGDVQRIFPPLEWDPFHALFDEEIAHGGPREHLSKSEVYERFESRRLSGE